MMGGVYISGIKLPKNEPGAFQVIVMYVGADGKLRAECEGTHEVVPVPPHGRLIDADALMEYIKNALGCYGNEYQIKTTFGALLDYIKARINDATTIIQAEGGE